MVIMVVIVLLTNCIDDVALERRHGKMFIKYSMLYNTFQILQNKKLDINQFAFTSNDASQLGMFEYIPSRYYKVVIQIIPFLCPALVSSSGHL